VHLPLHFANKKAVNHMATLIPTRGNIVHAIVLCFGWNHAYA